MEDQQIIQLYWDRNQAAISATSEKYGNFCRSIAQNILHSREDAEECVNDTYLNAWNSMPPHRPNVLSAFLGKITRNLAFNKYKANHADKRGNGEMTRILDELSECVSDKTDVNEELDRQALIQEIRLFLHTLSPAKRALFVRRYWYADSIPALAKHFNMTENHVSVQLHRLRTRLKAYLSERGFQL